MNDALRLADLLEDEVGVVEPLSVATELRRLDAENRQLKEHIELQDDDIANLLEQRKELLEALKGMVDYYGTASARVEQLDSARAAIAKAEGERE